MPKNRMTAPTIVQTTTFEGEDQITELTKGGRIFKEEGNIDSEVIWSDYVPRDLFFVSPYKQGMLEEDLKENDTRLDSIPVYNAKMVNSKKGLGFRTNYEIIQDEIKQANLSTLDNFCGDGEYVTNKIKVTPIAVSIHRENEHPLFGEGVIHLKLEDEAGGFFFTVSQEEGSMRIDYDAIKQLAIAAKFLLDGAGGLND